MSLHDTVSRCVISNEGVIEGVTDGVTVGVTDGVTVGVTDGVKVIVGVCEIFGV